MAAMHLENECISWRSCRRVLSVKNVEDAFVQCVNQNMCLHITLVTKLRRCRHILF